MALTKIKTGGITDSAITTAKINDDAVTDAKVADAITVTGAQTGITQVGTLTAGTWQGTAIASAYLDADTAYLSGTQTFSGAKTFSTDVNVTADGARLFVSSNDYELFSIGRAGSSGASLDQAYLRMKNAGTNTIALHTAGDSYFKGGSVGIGTTAPVDTLTVQNTDSGAATSAFAIKSNNGELNHAFFTSDADGGYLRIYKTDGSTVGTQIAGYATLNSYFNNGGNVGIGTASPGTTLSVTSANQVPLNSYSSGANSYLVTQVQEVQNNVAGIAFSVGSTAISSTASANSHAMIQGIVTNSGGAALTGELAFITNGGDSNSERMRIDSSGDICGNSGLTFYADNNKAGSNSGRLLLAELGESIFSSANNQSVSMKTYDGTEHKLTLDSSGNVIMQATKKLYLDGGGNTYIQESTGDNIIFSVGANGGFWSSSQFNVTGNGVFSGSISKTSGSFKIDHPLPSKKDTHYLVHSFTESPRADLIYRDKVTLVNGSATVNLDTVAGMTEGTFVLLCDNVQCFTSNESGWEAVKGSVSGNILTIECEDSSSTADISWMVVGDRKDQNIIDADWTDENGKPIIEPEKENA